MGLFSDPKLVASSCWEAPFIVSASEELTNNLKLISAFRWWNAYIHNIAVQNYNSLCVCRSHGSVSYSLAEATKAISRQAGLHTALSRLNTKRTMMEQLVTEVASPRTYAILKGYQERSKVTFFLERNTCDAHSRCSELSKPSWPPRRVMASHPKS